MSLSSVSKSCMFHNAEYALRSNATNTRISPVFSFAPIWISSQKLQKLQKMLFRSSTSLQIVAGGIQSFVWLQWRYTPGCMLSRGSRQWNTAKCNEVKAQSLSRRERSRPVNSAKRHSDGFGSVFMPQYSEEYSDNCWMIRYTAVLAMASYYHEAIQQWKIIDALLTSFLPDTEQKSYAYVFVTYQFFKFSLACSRTSDSPGWLKTPDIHRVRKKKRPTCFL